MENNLIYIRGQFERLLSSVFVGCSKVRGKIILDPTHILKKKSIEKLTRWSIWRQGGQFDCKEQMNSRIADHRVNFSMLFFFSMLSDN